MKLMKKNAFVAVLVLATLLLFACGGAEERKASYIAKAKGYVSEENFEKARIELKNALQISPKDIEARYMLAEVSEKLNDWQQAAANYRFIIDLDKKHVKARNQMGRLYFLSRNLKESRELADEVLRLDPNDVGGLTLSAAIYAQDNENEKAINDVLAALKTDPSNIEASALLASLYSKVGLTEKSEKLFLETIEKHPENIELRILLGDFYIKGNKDEEALAVFRQITEINPDLLMHRVRLASLLVRLNKQDEAENVLRDAIRHDPDGVEPKLILVDFFIRQDNKQQAEKELLAFIRQAPEAYKLRSGLAKFYKADGKPDKARKVYQEIIDAAGVTNDGLEARVKLARLLMKENDLQATEKLLDEVLKENVNHNEALISRGQIALANKDVDSAIAAFRSALKGQPNSAEIRLYLARAHMLNKEYRQAIDNLQSVLATEKNNQSARYTLAQAFSLNGDIEKSIEQYQALIKIDSENQKFRLSLFSLLIKSRNYVAARTLADDTKAANKDDFLGYYFSGVTYQSDKQFSESIKELKTALSMQPKSNKILVALVRSQLANKSSEEAISQLQKFITGSPGDVIAVNLLAEIYLRDKQYKQAISTLDKAKKIKPDWVNTYINKARVYLAISDKQAALDAIEKGIINTGGADVLVIEKSLLYIKFGDYDNAIANYELALKTKPDSIVLANNLAMALVTHKKDKESLSRARELIDIFIDSKSPALKDSVGWVLYKLGEVNQAIPYLEQAAVELSEVSVVNYHLGMAYFDKGDMKQSQQFLEKALAANAKFDGAEEAAATLDKIARTDTNGT